MKKLFLIIGEANSGKTTFANLLADAVDGEARDTSEALYKKYAQLTGYTIELSQKEQFRHDLVALGNLIRSRDPARLLAMTLYPEPPCPLVISGIRRKNEYAAAKSFAARRGHTIISIRISKPGTPPTDNFELYDTPTDYHFENCSTLEWLGLKALEIANEV